MLSLQKLGFTNAYALLGGIAAWTAAGLPTQPAPCSLDFARGVYAVRIG